MHSHKASLALGLAIMVVSGFAVVSAMDWPWKAALFPLVIGIPLFCLATIEVLCGFFAAAPHRQGGDAPSAAEPEVADSPRGIARATGWIFGFFAAIALFGFPIAVPLYVFVFVKWQGGEGWGTSLLFTAAVWAAFYGLFDRLLHLPFPPGWLQSWLA
jgi:Tripartite tricarboxylate transporter TctB family